MGYTVMVGKIRNAYQTIVKVSQGKRPLGRQTLMGE